VGQQGAAVVLHSRRLQMFIDSRTETQPLQASSLGLLLIKASEMDRMKEGFTMSFKTWKKWGQEKKFTSLYSQNQNVR